jgi:hypothetical protein
MAFSGKNLFFRIVPPSFVKMIRGKGGTIPSPFEEGILRNQAIFIHVPKAAGSSIIIQLYGKSMYGHRRIGEFYADDPEKAAAFFKFSFVRNPWDRMLSAFSYLHQENGSTVYDRDFSRKFLKPHADFNAFMLALEDLDYRAAVMKYIHFRPQARWICLPGEKTHAMDFLGRFETMEQDLAIVRERLGREAKPLAQVRPSKHLPYRDAYTDKTRRLIEEIYAEDIALLNYAF